MPKSVQPFYYLIGFVVTLWIIQVINLLTGNLLFQFGLLPREISGLDGVIAAPFLHGGFGHLISNSMGLVVLGGLVSLHGGTTFIRVSVFIALIGGLATWLVASRGIHIGASGLIFGYFGYLLARGVVEKTIKAIAIAIVVAILYSGLLWGVLPTQAGVSWEGHLFGFCAGLLAARWRIHGDHRGDQKE